MIANIEPTIFNFFINLLVYSSSRYLMFPFLYPLSMYGILILKIPKAIKADIPDTNNKIKTSSLDLFIKYKIENPKNRMTAIK